MIVRRKNRVAGWTWLRRLLLTHQGNVAVEFAFIVPVVLVMLAGLIEFGFVTYDNSAIENAARSGAQYAFSGSYDPSKIDAAVRAASTVHLASTDTVTSSMFCECGDGSKITCGQTCADLSSNKRFIKVNVTKNQTAWLPFMNFAVPKQLHASVTLRVQ